MSNSKARNEDPAFDLPTFIILVLTALVPIIVLPSWIDNAFRTPKGLLILLGVGILLGMYSLQFLCGCKILKSEAATPKIMLFLILLNFISLFYTQNLYYTKVAAIMNIGCLLFFYFVSLYIDSKKIFWTLGIVAFSGILVSIMTYLQFTEHFILFKPRGAMVIGTIGNSNSLGAYLIFPLFALSGMIFLLRGKSRLIPAGLLVFLFGAFLLSRARASWLGLVPALIIFVLLLIKIYNFSLEKYFKSHWRQVVIYGLVGLSLLIPFWLIAPQRFHDIMAFKSWTETKSLNFRLKHWRASYHLWIDNYPLFGTGLWSYRNLVYDAQAEINKIDPEYFEDYVKAQPRRVHNEYLEILNDGGVVAAFSLLLFFVIVMRHGYLVIRDPSIPARERVVGAMAFASMIGIMVSAFLFFAFRVNSTLFMAALMMGIMEGMYLRKYGLLSRIEGSRVTHGYFIIPLIFLVLIGIFCFAGYKPFIGEIEHVRYKECLAKGNISEAEGHILKAISHDPHNSTYLLNAGQLYMYILKDYVKAGEHINRAIVDFNGDLNRWGIYFDKGLMKLYLGSFVEAQAAFEKALYYNPNFLPASKKLKSVEKLIKYRQRFNTDRKAP